MTCNCRCDEVTPKLGHGPLTERQRKFLEIQRCRLGEVSQCFRLGLPLRRSAGLWIQRAEPSLGRGPHHCCQLDGGRGNAHKPYLTGNGTNTQGTDTVPRLRVG